MSAEVSGEGCLFGFRHISWDTSPHIYDDKWHFSSVSNNYDHIIGQHHITISPYQPPGRRGEKKTKTHKTKTQTKFLSSLRNENQKLMFHTDLSHVASALQTWRFRHCCERVLVFCLFCLFVCLFVFAFVFCFCFFSILCFFNKCAHLEYSFVIIQWKHLMFFGLFCVEIAQRAASIDQT